MPDDLVLTRPGDDDSLPVVVTVTAGDGVWTPGPCVQVEVGNQTEMGVEEFAWLVEDAGPKALERLRALNDNNDEGATP